MNIFEKVLTTNVILNNLIKHLEKDKIILFSLTNKIIYLKTVKVLKKKIQNKIKKDKKDKKENSNYHIKRTFKNDELLSFNEKEIFKVFYFLNDPNILYKNLCVCYSYYETFFEKKLKTLPSKIKFQIFLTKFSEKKNLKEAWLEGFMKLFVFYKKVRMFFNFIYTNDFVYDFYEEEFYMKKKQFINCFEDEIFIYCSERNIVIEINEKHNQRTLVVKKDKNNIDF